MRVLTALGAALQPVDRAADVPALLAQLLSDGRVVHHAAVRGAMDAARRQLRAHQVDTLRDGSSGSGALASGGR